MPFFLKIIVPIWVQPFAVTEPFDGVLHLFSLGTVRTQLLQRVAPLKEDDLNLLRQHRHLRGDGHVVRHAGAVAFSGEHAMPAGRTGHMGQAFTNSPKRAWVGVRG